MAQHIDNLRGEQGGAVLQTGESFTADTYGKAEVLQIKVLEDDTTFSSITMPDVAGGKAYYEAASLSKGDFIDGRVTAATVSGGAIQVFLHRKSDA